jgi:hypothetical protein
MSSKIVDVLFKNIVYIVGEDEEEISSAEEQLIKQ